MDDLPGLPSADLDNDVVQYFAGMRQAVSGIRQVSIDLTSLEGVDDESDRERDRFAVRAKGFEQAFNRRYGRAVPVVVSLDVLIRVQQIGERPAINFFRAAFGLARRIGVFLGARRVGGQLAKASLQREDALLEQFRHFQHMAVRLYIQDFHFPDRRLGVVDDVVDRDDGTVQVLPVHGGGEGLVEDVNIARLEFVTAFLEFAHLPGLVLIATRHERHEFSHHLDRELALLVDQAIEVRHAWKHPADQPGDQRI